VRFGRSILRPFHQLWQLGDVDGNAPSFIARQQVHALARPLVLSLDIHYFCRALAIGLKCSSICSSVTGFSNIITPSCKAGAEDSIEPESIITGMPSWRSCAIKVQEFSPRKWNDVGPACHNRFPRIGRRGCRPGHRRPQQLQVLL
jgi:hypothetical protein